MKAMDTRERELSGHVERQNGVLGDSCKTSSLVSQETISPCFTADDHYDAEQYSTRDFHPRRLLPDRYTLPRTVTRELGGNLSILAI